jgi:hypothetical protein
MKPWSVFFLFAKCIVHNCYSQTNEPMIQELRIRGRVKSLKQEIYLISREDKLLNNKSYPEKHQPGFRIEGIKWENFSNKSFYIHINKKELPDSMVYFSSNGSTQNIYRYEYDIYRNVVRERIESFSSLGKLTANHSYFYHYNSAGEITEKVTMIDKIFRNLETFSYAFFLQDGVREVTLKSVDNQQLNEYTHNFRYDKDGNILQLKKYGPDSLAYEKKLLYDNKKRLVLENEIIMIEGHIMKQETKYSYGEGVLPVKITGGDGMRLYEYDSLGNVTSYKWINSENAVIRNYSFRYEFDQNNNWVRRYWFDSLSNTMRFCTQRNIEYYHQRELERPGPALYSN